MYRNPVLLFVAAIASAAAFAAGTRYPSTIRQEK